MGRTRERPGRAFAIDTLTIKQKAELLELRKMTPLQRLRYVVLVAKGRQVRPLRGGHPR